MRGRPLNPNRPPYGWHLVALRKSRNLTLKQVAAATGINWTTIQSYEFRGSRPDFPEAAKLAKLYGITIAQVLKLEDFET